MPEEAYIQETIKAFAPLQLPAPELTPKYLKRPPFRFIHDIVSAINARFAAYDHVIPKGMENADAIDTKEKKIEYLKALIKYVGKLLGQKLDVSAKKIVAGHEAEKTNAFLQALANAVGYAQKDKAEHPPPPPPPPEDAGATATGEDVPPPPPPVDYAAEKDAAAQAMGFPSRQSLPRRKSSMSPANEDAKAKLVGESQEFTRKLKSYALNINIDEKRDISKEGESMVSMWRELETYETETQPTQMPVETLEAAIQRQITQIKQIQDLQRENDAVAKKLEDALTS